MILCNYFKLKPGKIYACGIDDRSFKGKFVYKLEKHYLVYRKVGHRKWVQVINSKWYSEDTLYVEVKPAGKKEVKADPFPHAYICSACAKRKKLRWEKGNCATQQTDTCPYCGLTKGLCAVRDYLKPGEKTIPLIRWD